MIKIIDKTDDFEVEKRKFKKIFKENESFPSNVFSNEFNLYITFEFELYFYKFFFEGIQKFIYKIKDQNYTFFTTNPSADEYFYKKYKKYGIGVISTMTSVADFYNSVNFDFVVGSKSEKYTDSLAITTNSFACFSNIPIWGIWGDRNWEIGIVGFKEKTLMKLFVDSFDENKNIFSSLTERIEDLDNMLCFSEKTKKDYLKLMKNYQSKQ